MLVHQRVHVFFFQWFFSASSSSGPMISDTRLSAGFCTDPKLLVCPAPQGRGKKSLCECPLKRGIQIGLSMDFYGSIPWYKYPSKYCEYHFVRGWTSNYSSAILRITRCLMIFDPYLNRRLRTNLSQCMTLQSVVGREVVFWMMRLAWQTGEAFLGKNQVDIWLVVTGTMEFGLTFQNIWECHHPNWLIFFWRGRLKPPTSDGDVGQKQVKKISKKCCLKCVGAPQVPNILQLPKQKIWPNTASDSKVLPIWKCPGVMGISRFMRNPMRSSFSSLEMVKGATCGVLDGDIDLLDWASSPFTVTWWFFRYTLLNLHFTMENHHLFHG